jgi:RNA polymerase sigma-70 factor (ECF subfamily)
VSEPAAPGESVGALVEGLFRREAGRLVARLARIFGTASLELAEDVVQDALLKALRNWSINGTPSDPHAWLVRVAKNLAIDRVRRDARLASKASELEAWDEHIDAREHAPAHDASVDDDELAMMFACCHPELSRDARVALTLKTVGGFGAPEIARAFLESEAAAAQRLVRAKAKLRETRVEIACPSGPELAARLDSVQDVVYFMLGEGLAAHRGDALIRVDLVREALRLASQLARNELTATPRTHALAALAHFHASRIPARVDEAGGILLLEEQDRRKWNRALIARGFEHLHRAARGAELSEFHLEAGIASQHALASTWEDTDWRAILGWYDLLAARNASPIVLLNRAVAVGKVHGASAGLRELATIESAPALANYHLRPSIKGELLRQLDRRAEAADALREALRLCQSGPERAFLERRLAALER